MQNKLAANAGPPAAAHECDRIWRYTYGQIKILFKLDYISEFYEFILQK